MRGPRVYGSVSDVYTRKNNYVNDSLPEVGGNASSMLIRDRVDVYTWQNKFLNNF